MSQTRRSKRISYEKLLEEMRAGEPPPERLLALDPGETMGWALFKDGMLYDRGQVLARNAPEKAAYKILQSKKPTEVVCEDYRIYSWKVKDHAFDSLFTPKLIGMIQQECFRREIPIHLQMAVEAKSFVTDDKLKAWGMFPEGRKLRHSADAMRHAIRYLMFFGR